MSATVGEILALLEGKRLERFPVFSGLPSLTRLGLEACGLQFGEVHRDAAKMAAAAATTYELFGFESAVVPFDLCVEAEALGCEVNFNDELPFIVHPTIATRLGSTPEGLDLHPPLELALAGRLPVVMEAIWLLKSRVGREVAVGAWIPGPFTLAWQIIEVEPLILSVASPAHVAPLLARLAAILAQVARCYREAGADFITIHEMGGSPRIVGPQAFRTLILPALRSLIAQVPAPRVLSVCGHTQPVMADLTGCGVEAISVDQRCDLARAREVVGPEPLLFGNFDPVGVLADGTPETVAATVRAIAAAGADAIWPGCDLWPEVPAENMSSLVETAKGLRRNGRP
ncbi:MAG: hypothetical protein M5U01_01850 [Ardenticatenaceae bacterium]|nr:hypothetical protein [Ardenticatenaceae bacterium]HBY94209.1 methyltransferase [Chloroflexota bacterium]